MRKILILSIALAALAASASLPASADHPEHPSSRVIVSTTLNNTLQFFDAATLGQTQPPLVSKGTSPVRLWTDAFPAGALPSVSANQYLFSANHGVEGSVGVFDLSGDIVTELPLSPFPARAGAVGIAAGEVGPAQTPMVFVTNTWQALGGCDLPNGSVTAFDASLLTTAGVLAEAGTVDVTGAIPYAVAVDEGGSRAFATTNCDNTVETIDVTGAGLASGEPISVAHAGTRGSGGGPDATLFDQGRDLLYTVNIGGDSLTVNDVSSPAALTTVPLPNAGPIDATLATHADGREWVITSNGQNDTISIIDRAVIDACIAGLADTCPQAVTVTIPTAVAGGAPEGVAYDPVSNRVFVVNKPIMGPSLSVIQLTDGPTGLTGTDIEQIPLNAVGTDVPVPAVIAFDVVVQTR